MSFSEIHDDNKSSMSNIQSPTKIQESNESVKIHMDYDINEILVVGDEIKDLIGERSDVLKDLFSKYSNFGDKLTMNKINMTGYMKFLRDCNLTHITQNNKNITNGSINIFPTRSVSPKKSMSNNFNILNECNNSTISKKNNSIKKGSLNKTNGKLLEIDAQIIFNNLTGSVNFDKSLSIKTHFDKNKGLPTNWNETKVSKISINQSLASSKLNCASRMDFNLFIKSFELIAKKIYPEKDLDDAIFLFLENVKILLN